MSLWTPIGESTHTHTHTNEPANICITQIQRTHLHLPLPPFRSELSLQPITEGDADNQGEQFEVSEGFSYEDISNQQTEARLQQTCRRQGNQGGVMMINIVPLRDTVTFKHTGEVGENFDVPFVLHLWPSFLIRNLLPYPITYKLKVQCFLTGYHKNSGGLL